MEPSSESFGRVPLTLCIPEGYAAKVSVSHFPLDAWKAASGGISQGEGALIRGLVQTRPKYDQLFPSSGLFLLPAHFLFGHLDSSSLNGDSDNYPPGQRVSGTHLLLVSLSPLLPSSFLPSYMFFCLNISKAGSW